MNKVLIAVIAGVVLVLAGCTSADQVAPQEPTVEESEANQVVAELAWSFLSTAEKTEICAFYEMDPELSEQEFREGFLEGNANAGHSPDLAWDTFSDILDNECDL